MVFFVTTAVLAAVSAVVWCFVNHRLRYLESYVKALDLMPIESNHPFPFVSIVVPARNEEKIIGTCLENLQALEYPNYEVIIVDDHSSDNTRARAKAAISNNQNTQLLSGTARPSAEWGGKSWALTEGVAKSRGEWLLFVDADVLLEPSSLTRAMVAALSYDTNVVSVLPAVKSESIWARLIMPLFGLLSALLDPCDQTNAGAHSGARLSGAFILIKRVTYEAVGGHASVKSEIVEDIALANRIKQEGHCIFLTFTQKMVKTSMYETFAETWEGLTRVSYPTLDYSLLKLGMAHIMAFIGTGVPWFAIFMGVILLTYNTTLGLITLFLGVLVLLISIQAMKTLLRYLYQSRISIFFLPLAATILCLAVNCSAMRYYAGRGCKWKGRIYH